jgi:uncharacterized tellurite resistance protein B-like protein
MSEEAEWTKARRQATLGLEAVSPMPESPSQDSHFYTEVLKLLLQVITSDEQLAPRELEEFLEVAKKGPVPGLEVAALIGCLREGQPLPSPDMGLLRTRPKDVIQAARIIAACDKELDINEIDMLVQIRELLGI